MRAAIERFYGKIKSASTAPLFSGYGIQSDRQTYVIPVNAQIWTEADVRRDGYSLDLLLAEMNKRGASVKIAILDASRRNPFERRFRAVAGGLAPVIIPKGTVVMYAAAPGAVARDGDRAIFVNELIKEIRNPGRIEEAFNRTLVGVSRSSQGDQVVVFLFAGRDFFFATSARATPEPAPPVAGGKKAWLAACGRVEKNPRLRRPIRRQCAPPGRVSAQEGLGGFRGSASDAMPTWREQIAKLAPPAAPLADDPAIKEKTPRSAQSR